MEFKHIFSVVLMIGFLVQTGSALAECGTVATAFRNEGAQPLDVWYTDCQGARKKRRVEDLGNAHEALVGSEVVIGFFDSAGNNYITEGGSTIHSGYNQFGCHGGFFNTACKRER